jgi:hypothetical protein
MKTRVVILLAVSAIVTLSFTFASVKESDKKQVSSTTERAADAPVGGLGSEDKF